MWGGVHKKFVTISTKGAAGNLFIDAIGHSGVDSFSAAINSKRWMCHA